MITAVELTPGGAGGVALYKVTDGNVSGAAMEMLFFIPWDKLVAKGVEYVAVRVAESKIFNIPVKA